MNMQSISETQAATRNIFVERITAIWHRSREQIMELGKALIEAKAQLPHGQFTTMIEQDLPFGPDSARQLMRIAADPRLSNHDTYHALPPSPAALDNIRKLPDEQLAAAINTGDVHPRMTVEDARALIGKPREPVHVEPRKANELKHPIIGPTDFLATMKGYRVAQGISQAQVDTNAGMEDWRYIGKLELDVRRAINESGWDWLNALRLCIILVPAVDAVRADKCPCCGAVKV